MPACAVSFAIVEPYRRSRSTRSHCGLFGPALSNDLVDVPDDFIFVFRWIVCKEIDVFSSSEYHKFLRFVGHLEHPIRFINRGMFIAIPGSNDDRTFDLRKAIHWAELIGRNPEPRIQLDKQQWRNDVMKGSHSHLDPIMNGLCDRWVNRFQHHHINVRISEYACRAAQGTSDDGYSLCRIELANKLNRCGYVMPFKVPHRDVLASRFSVCLQVK